MEQQVIELLRATQSTEQSTRQSAESQLDQLRANDEVALALTTIGSSIELPVGERQSALILLRKAVRFAWSEAQEDYEDGPVLQPQTRETIRNNLLHIVFASDNSKITNSAANTIAAIASSDFPEDWPNLLGTVLAQLHNSNDDQTHAILVVLDELLAGGLDEASFYAYASDIVNDLHRTASDGSKKLNVRAHTISVFRKCFDFVENLKHKEEEGIRAFTHNVCNTWAPFFLQVTQETLPAQPSVEEEERGGSDSVRYWRGVIALKIQAVMTLARIEYIFPGAMPAQEFFDGSWNSLQALAQPYFDSFVQGDRQGSLMDQYNLPYTLDLLATELIDYLQTLLRAPTVASHLQSMREADLANGSDSVRSWVQQVLQSLTVFTSATAETEQMWELDYNCYLSDETYAESTSSTRSVCQAFLMTLNSAFPSETLEGLYTYAQAVVGSQSQPWRTKEAVLFMLQQSIDEYSDSDRPPPPSAAEASLHSIQAVITHENAFLRARAFTLVALVVSAWSDIINDPNLVMNYANLTLHALENDPDDLVKATCIRIVKDYLSCVQPDQRAQLQPRIVNGIAIFLQTQDFDSDMDDYTDLVDAVVLTVRDTIMANPEASLDHNALDVLLTLVKLGGAKDSSSTIPIDEAFESAAEAMAKLGVDHYTRLCDKILPSITAAMDLQEPNSAESSSLTDVSISVMKILAESATDPLPSTFIPAAFPRLYRLFFIDTDFFQRQIATEAISHMVANNKDAVFNWYDPHQGKNGLQLCFDIVAHLLSPGIDDADAAEVGGLAVTIIEQAGSAVLGNALNELLHHVVNRLATAEKHDLIQSLSMVFARLALIDTAAIVNFLAEYTLGGLSALSIVLKKWLENAGHFVGFDTIRQNAMALVAMYKLNDSRVEAVVVDGDLIPDTDSRIKTRSMAKKQPIRYTQIPATLKIVKLLVAELLPQGDPNNAFATQPHTPLKSPPFGATRRGSTDDEWEDDEDDEIFGKQADDQTQMFLVEFVSSEGSDVRFQHVFGQLTEEEQNRAKLAVRQRFEAQAHGSVGMA